MAVAFGNSIGRSLWAVVACAGAAGLCGCAADPYVNQHIEALNAEYRALEDYVNQLEHENDDLCSELDRLAEEIERLKKGEAPQRRTPLGRTRSNSSGGAAGGESAPLQPPRIETPEFEPPMIELPGPQPGGAQPPVNPAPLIPAPVAPPVRNPPGAAAAPSLAPADTGARARPILEAPSEPEPAQELPPPPAAKPAPVDPEPIDGRVTHLYLHPNSGGADFDPRPGDDGLQVILEPRNRQDQFVNQPGALSVAVLDPTQQGDASRIALWNFSAEAIGKQTFRTADKRGVVLQLPWPARPPEQAKLRLFVRYVTPDGRQLRQEREIYITTPSQFAQRWAPRGGATPPSSAAGAASAGSRLPGPPPTAAEPDPATAPAPSAPPTSAAAGPAATAPAPALLEPPPALGAPEAQPPARPGWKPFR